VRRCKFHLRVVKAISFHHEKIKFISSNRRVIFFLLYSHKTQSAIKIFHSLMLILQLITSYYRFEEYMDIILDFSCSTFRLSKLKYRDLSCASRSIMGRIIDLRDTNKSRYFARTEFNNCFIIHFIVFPILPMSTPCPL
jgi:hypothetical protein